MRSQRRKLSSVVARRRGAGVLSVVREGSQVVAQLKRCCSTLLRLPRTRPLDDRGFAELHFGLRYELRRRRPRARVARAGVAASGARGRVRRASGSRADWVALAARTALPCVPPRARQLPCLASRRARGIRSGVDGRAVLVRFPVLVDRREIDEIVVEGAAEAGLEHGEGLLLVVGVLVAFAVAAGDVAEGRGRVF